MKKRVYLDNASTTPLDKAVLEAMMPYLTHEYGNPSNLYAMGRHAKSAIATANITIAKYLNCRPDEFIFTGSATESDNMAIIGTVRVHKNDGNRIIISSLEHKGIISACEALEKEGFEIIKLPVGKDSIVNLDELKRSLNEKTLIVSITSADSETGTLQPIQEISKIIKDFRGNKSFPYFHTDASQSATYENINVNKLGIDMMTLSAHKMGGPKGIGGLYIKRGVKISPIIYGGGQQGRLRSGTENVPAIVGFGTAMEINEKRKKKDSIRIGKLRDRLERGISKSIDKVVLNGHKKNRLPNFLNISILDIEGEALLLSLDELGIMINTGSACNSESLEPSYVLTAMGNPYEFVHGSIRFTLGHNTKKSDIDYVVRHLPKIVEKLRKISPLNLSIDQKNEISDKKAFIGNQTPHFLRKVRK